MHNRGPMPLNLTHRILARMSERWFHSSGPAETADTAFLDFCNLLQHRMIALYWRAWADAQPGAQLEIGGGGRIRAMQGALAGIGMPGSSGPDGPDPQLMLRFATSLSQEVRGPERLTQPLGELLAAPVRLEEFTGHWLAIPAPLQTRPGLAHARLGQGAVVGARSFQRQTRAAIRVGPLNFPRYVALIEDRRLRADLRRTIRFVMGEEISFDLRPVLARQEVPDAGLGLGTGGEGRLGRTLWLAPPRRRDADDLCLEHFSTRAEAPA